jgi:vacuolar-type H+-ATPase subunit E/Vma4
VAKSEAELEQKKRDLKTKQTYLKSQRKKLNSKIPGMPTLEHGYMDIDLICQEIDLLCLEKNLHEKLNKSDLETLELTLASQITNLNQVTDCIYGLITFIVEKCR